ncbi:MAG TPA: hypothetical protein VFD70_30280 [Anaerolineae bacterium]|nr:hypothetical protein [Anaerolineae bacterium]
MGTGMMLLAHSRGNLGWSHARIVRFLMLRGARLIVLTFLLLALGINLSLLYAFSRPALEILTRRLSPLIVFGTTPLFFYLTHLYLYGFIGRVFFPNGTPTIPAMYPWWLLGLVILYPLCLLYGKFKTGRGADSVWRFF